MIGELSEVSGRVVGPGLVCVVCASLSLFRQFFKIARTRERFRIGILFIPLRVLVREIQLSVETKSKREWPYS